MKLSPSLPMTLVAAISLSLSHAAVLAFTDFNDTVKSGASQTMTGIDWTSDDHGGNTGPATITAGTEVTTVASNNTGYFTTDFGATGFAPDQNIENEGPWAATFELTVLSGASVTLTSIDFLYAGLNNSGGTQGANFRAQNFDISVNGSVYDAQKQTTAVNGALIFTESVALMTGSNSIVITSSEVNGPGYNMGIDDLNFTGDIGAIPEASTAGLLALAMLAAGRRRRRASVA